MKRKIAIGVLLTVLLVFGVVVFCDQKVAYNANGRMYEVECMKMWIASPIGKSGLF